MKKTTDFARKPSRQKDQRAWVNDDDQYFARKAIKQQYKRKPKYRNGQEWEI